MLSDLSQYVAVIGAGAAAFADTLGRYFADVILLPPFCRLSEPVASHPDMLLARVGQTSVMPASYAESFPGIAEAIAGLCTLRLGQTVPASPYPGDVAYNVLCYGGRLYCRTDVLDGTAAISAAEQGISLCHVRQGYAGCCALSCGDFVMTADPSLQKALMSAGASVVPLRLGGIHLPGYDCGFIGGASGYCAGTAIFFGDPETHPDAALIRRTLDAKEIDCLALSGDTLTDFGGIICFPKKTG